MKGLTKLLGALLVFSTGASASAIQFQFKGDLYNRMMVYTDQAPLYAASETVTGTPVTGANVAETWGEIKYRLQAEASTDDKLVRGVYAIELGALRFGLNAQGAAPSPASTGRNTGGNFSGDGVNLETRFAYVDFGLPMPQGLRLSFGLQPFAVNRFLWQETAMGIQVKGDVGPAAMTLAWMRGLENLSTNSVTPQFGDADNVLVRGDLKPSKDLKAGLFALYQHRNVNAALAATIPHLLKNFTAQDYNLLNLGVDGAMTFGPIFVNADFIYQTGVQSRSTATPLATADSLDVNAFLVHGDVGVNLGAAKLTYTGWYATGDDDGTDDERKNYLATDLDTPDSIIFFEGGFTDDVYFTEAPYFLDRGAIFNKLALDFKMSDKVTLGAAGIYVMSAEDFAIGTGATADTSKNLGLEFDGYIAYKMNANLELGVNAGYLISGDAIDAFEGAAFRDGEAERNIFRSTARARYTF